MIQLSIILQFGSEFEIGYLDAIFGTIGMITSILVNRYLKVSQYKRAFTIAAITTVMAVIPFIFQINYTIFLIYNIVFNITHQIIGLLYSMALFEINNLEKYKDYKLECVMLKEIYLAIGRVVGYLALYIVGAIAFHINSINLLIILASSSMLIQMLLYRKIEQAK